MDFWNPPADGPAGVPDSLPVAAPDRLHVNIPVSVPAGASGIITVELLAQAMEKAILAFDAAHVVASADTLAKSAV